MLLRSLGLGLEHVPEKRKPVFRKKDMHQQMNLGHLAI